MYTPHPTTLSDHENSAQQTLPAAHWAYLFGGAADELTLRKNTTAWQHIELLPRVLRSVQGGHTRIQLFGREYAHPILVAPMAYQQLAHPAGELATALAAAALEAGFVCSTQASTSLENIAELYLPEQGRGPLWFQLYMQHEREFTLELVQRAEQAGYEALVLTVDAPVSGVRDRERQHSFALPAGIEAVNLKHQPLHAPTPFSKSGSVLFDHHMAHAPTWTDVDWLASHTRLPVILKGITHPADATSAIEHGAQGLIVSNHGGRVLDTMPATATVLPSIVKAVHDRVPVLVDGGLRRGSDVFKAVALGATAVLVGRPVLHGLVNQGAQGVAHVLRLLRDELEITMALCGCATLAQVDESMIGG
ncbi:MAG: alpha-hydroxy acid oxidase [Limnobacter sp.]|uniref:alpha-hydroxy acid oxidase n=1 Tax=Limnobacter sp. TaxID=2003368 RepID=UPI0022C96B45|nr:alpha-hydroxy acid oxidase [Limnobacter sp.]MCZ8014642.1 alpha-hydroxy acid oxidase [Limnobacter sp.]